MEKLADRLRKVADKVEAGTPIIEGATHPAAAPKEMAKALVNLRDAFYKIDTLWDDAGYDDAVMDQVNDALTRKYPFKDSFDEVANAVDSWVKDANRHLKKIRT